MRLSDRLKRDGWTRVKGGGWERKYAGCRLYLSPRCYTATIDRDDFDVDSYVIFVEIGKAFVPEGLASLAQRAKAAARKLSQTPKEKLYYIAQTALHVESMKGLPPLPLPPMQQMRPYPEMEPIRFTRESLVGRGSH